MTKEEVLKILADNDTNQAVLDSTDWFVTRKAETGLEIPENVLTLRAEARGSINRIDPVAWVANNYSERATSDIIEALKIYMDTEINENITDPNEYIDGTPKDQPE